MSVVDGPWWLVAAFDAGVWFAVVFLTFAMTRGRAETTAGMVAKGAVWLFAGYLAAVLCGWVPWLL